MSGKTTRAIEDIAGVLFGIALGGAILYEAVKYGREYYEKKYLSRLHIF